jgi:chemotaxis protein MotB
MSNAPIIIVKKKVMGHGAHGAAWKVAYADFVTAMMALFMVLWLLSQTEETELKKLSEYFRTGVFSGAPSVLEGGSGLLDQGFLEESARSPLEKLWTAANADELREKLAGIMKQNIDLEGFDDVVTVTAKPEGVQIEFRDTNEDVLFSLSSSKLQAGLVKVLTALGPTLQASGYHVRIEGHTDARPFPKGSDRTNWDLSYERAGEARKVLTRAGLAESAIVGVYALGSSALLDAKNPEAAVNRRLTLLAIPKEGKPPAKKGKAKRGALDKPVETTPQDDGSKSKSRQNFERALGVKDKAAQED